MANKAVFFDRDGTLNVDVITCIGLRILNGSPRRKKPSNTSTIMGIFAILVTNQSGVARGCYQESDVRLVYDWMNEQLAVVRSAS